MRSTVTLQYFSLCCLSLLLAGGDIQHSVASSAELDKSAADCGCGPDYSKDDPRYIAELAAKKTALKKKKYPADLIALMDRDGACLARINQSPNGFTILSIKPNGDKAATDWSEDQEAAIKRGLVAGTYTEYYKFNVSHAFCCCGDPKFSSRSDYNAKIDLNTKLAIRCTLEQKVVQCR